MNEISNPGIQLSGFAESYSVEPGSNVEIAFNIANQSSTADQVRLAVDGIPLVWVSMEQSTIHLSPGEEKKVSFTIQVPATTGTHAGRYPLVLRAASLLKPGPASELAFKLTVAAYEAKGRITVLMDATSFSVKPGESLSIPLVLINQGLTPDVIRPEIADLPQAWLVKPGPSLSLAPEETQETSLLIEPPRDPETRPGRHPFVIRIQSQAAPDQVTVIKCTLSVAVFTLFTAQIVPTDVEMGKTVRVNVSNLGNAQESFNLSLTSTDEALVFEDLPEADTPEQPEQMGTTSTLAQPLILPQGESSSWGFMSKQAKRPVFGSLTSYPYKATVESGGKESQELEAAASGKALMPMWVLAVGAGALILLLLALLFSFFRGGLSGSTPVPTSTTSDTDQRAFLVDRTWYLVSYNNNHSVAGAKEPYTRFNQDGTFIGNTGCKDFTGTYTTSFNTIKVNTLNTAPDDCGDPNLMPQEKAMLDFLRGAQSYYVADTVMQIASSGGYLNYSLSPTNRPEEQVPPLAVINGPTQAMVNQIVTLDGQASSGQTPIVRWQWDFGDKGRGDGPVVQHVYANPGRYRVQMTVTDQNGLRDSEALEIEILAQPTATSAPTNTPAPVPTDQPTPTAPPEPTQPPEMNPPQAGITAPQAGFVGEPALIDASKSQAGSSPIASYTWNFGNGSSSGPSMDTQAQVIYEQSGVYEVTVLITDENGLSSSASTSIRIDARLDTVVWTLDAINNQVLVPGTAVTLQFLQGKIEGFAGCNTYSADYTAVDNGDGTYSVEVTRLKTSKLLCPKEIMDQETLYLRIFEQLNTASVQGNVLTLASPEGTLVLHEVGTPKPELLR